MKYLQNRLGERFEFRGTQKLKKQYEKENQKELTKALFNVISKEDFDRLSENRELMRELVLKYSPDLDLEEITNKINRKYIITLLCYTNNIIEEQAELLLLELDEDYGEEQVNERLADILNEVFTQVGNVEYKTMPTWN